MTIQFLGSGSDNPKSTIRIPKFLAFFIAIALCD